MADLCARALAVIQALHKRLGGKLPIIGVGGISDADSAQATLDAGASLIQIYTGLIYRGPTLIDEICRALD